MRGKVDAFVSVVYLFGITPAYAGKSFSGFRRLPEPRDHPRVCGEKFIHVGGVVLHLGSPPRMRGKEAYKQILEKYGGITPAYAGKSF